MAIEYDFFKTNGALADKEGYHVRVVDHETVDTETIIERIQQGTTLTVHDLKGAISALSQEITNHLKEGRKVHLEGLGFFSVSIDGKIETDKNDQLRLKNPRVRTIKFQPEEHVLRQMEDLSFSCQHHKGRHSQEINESEIWNIINRLLSVKPFFTANDFFKASQVTPPTGYRTLNHLLALGQLKNIGTPGHKLYTLPQKHTANE